MLVQQIISGLAVGCIYGLVALGFVLIWKATEVINFAQGELMMVGAFLAFTFIHTFDFPIWIAFLLTILSMSIFGIVLERIFIRPMIGQPVFSIVMLTFGLSIIMRSSTGIIWTHEILLFPDIFSRKVARYGPLSVSSEYFWIIIVSFLLIVSLYLFFKFTKIGTSMRACGMNQLATLYMGISVKRIFSLTWVVSSIIAAIAGILIAPVIFLSTNMGFLGIKAIPAAILGGFGSIPGAIIGGLILGVSETLAGLYLPAGVKDVFPYLILILVMIIKPTGIFGTPEKKRV